MPVIDADSITFNNADGLGALERTGENSGAIRGIGPGDSNNLARMVDITAGSSKFVASVSSIAALKSLSISGYSAGNLILVTGYHSGSTLGGGIFIVIDDAGESDDGGHIIAPNSASGNKKYARIVESRMSAKVTDFGAKGDLSTDDTAAIQAAVDTVEAAAFNSNGSDVAKYPYGGEIYFPPINKGYKITSTINIPSTIFGFRLHGGAFIKNFTTTGNNSRIFRLYAATASDFPANNLRGFVIDGFAFDWNGGSTDGVAFYFDNQVSSSHLVQLGVIQNCYMREGKHFIHQHETGGTYISSLAVRDCIVQNISSSAVKMTLDQVGCTALTIENMWTQSSTSDPHIDISAFHSFEIHGCSFESSPGAAHAPTFRFNNCQGACSFRNNRTEWGGAGGKNIIQLNGGASTLHVQDVEFRHHTVASGQDVTIFDLPNAGSEIIVDGIVGFEQADYDGSNELRLFDLGTSAKATWDGIYFNQNRAAGSATPTFVLKTGAGTIDDRTI